MIVAPRAEDRAERELELYGRPRIRKLPTLVDRGPVITCPRPRHKPWGLSDDRRFATAYNTAQQTANMATACAGYRVTAKTGHHKVTVDAIILALGAAARPYADYLETCRHKRNVIDYTRSHGATESEADEIIRKTMEFHELVETWIGSKFASLKR